MKLVINENTGNKRLKAVLSENGKKIGNFC